MDITRDKQEILKLLDGWHSDPRRLIIVEAPPGTGKTFLAILCAHRLIEHSFVEPYEKVLVLTFSKNAKAQLERELERIITDKKLMANLELSSFHAFFMKYVWAYRQFLGLPLNLEVVCPDKRKLQVTQALSQKGIQIKDRYIEGASCCLEYSCQHFIPPTAQLPGKYHRDIPIIVQEILNLNKEGYISYSDFGYYFQVLLRKAPDFLEILRMKYPFIILDEYQDSSDLQDDIIRMVLGDKGKAIVLADEMQIIHQWRGASKNRIINLKKDFPYFEKTLNEFPRYEGNKLSDIFLKLREIIRNENFDRKIRISNDLIEKWSNPVRGNFLKNITLPPHKKERNINSYLAKSIINQLVKSNQNEQFYSSAILLTQNEDVKNFKRILREKNIPIKEISNGNKLHNFAGLLLENINNTNLQKRRIFIAKTMSFISLKQQVRSGLSWEKLVSNLQQGSCKISGNKKDIRDDLEAVAIKTDCFQNILIKLIETINRNKDELIIDWDIFHLLSNISKALEKREELTAYEICTNLVLQEQHILSHRKLNGIYVMTVHQAKGKEFDWVILPDVSESAFKSNDPESRRLFYVAVTRAKKKISFYDRENISKLAKVLN